MATSYRRSSLSTPITGPQLALRLKMTPAEAPIGSAKTSSPIATHNWQITIARRVHLLSMLSYLS